MRKIFAELFVAQIIILNAFVHSFAGETTLRCRVQNEYHLTDEGQLVKPEKYYYTKASFSVERSTGRIIGGAFSNKGDYQMKVIDGDSFKVFSFAEKRGVAESLSIKTWQEGKIKPFVGIDYLQTVVTGICD